MVGKNQIRFLKSLALKKNRIKYNKIVVEGTKTIKEFMDSKYELDQLYSLDSKKINNFHPEIITKSQLKSISSQKTPNGTLAVFNIADKSIQDSSFYVVLDNISDPGN